MISAFNNFASNSTSDPDAALISVVVFYQGEFLWNLDLEYAKPIVNPPIFHEFSAIPHTSSTTRITNLTDLTLELNTENPYGLREKYSTFTVRNSPVLQAKMIDIFMEEARPIANVSGLVTTFEMLPITESTVAQFAQRGGNALGISTADAPLILAGVPTRWADAADDARILQMVVNVIDRSVAAAKEMGLEHRYIYQNYAYQGQDVFKGYGDENLAKLRAVSRKYDPEAVFQKLQPGYFKLGGI